MELIREQARGGQWGVIKKFKGDCRLLGKSVVVASNFGAKVAWYWVTLDGAPVLS